LPETHVFLKAVRRLLDAEYPGRVLIAEANQWPEDLLPYFGDGDEFHVCFHFPIMPRLYMALKRGDKMPIIDILSRTPPIPPGTQWMTFLRNHDELTLEMVTPEERQWMWEQYAPELRMRLNLGIRRRLMPLLDDDRRRWLALNALFLSLPGTPILYYGDEIGMGDNIWLEDRHGCRTPMQWSAERHAGFSEAARTYQPVIDQPPYDYRTRNAAAQEADPDSYLNLTRFLIATRQGQPALRAGALAWVETSDAAVLAFRRMTEGAPAVLCLFNLSDSVRPGLALPADMRDLLSREGRVFAAKQQIELAPFAAHWFVEEA
jgi:maltose alpha-D-glucosyltransferase/alpha-amylase